MKVFKKVLFNFSKEEEEAIRTVDRLLNEMCNNKLSSCEKCVFNKYCNDCTLSIKDFLEGMLGYDVEDIE